MIFLVTDAYEMSRRWWLHDLADFFFPCPGEEPCESDEDTEEASENEFRRHEPPPQSLPPPPPMPVTPREAPREVPDLKEQIYQEKLNHLKSQLQQLATGTLPEYLKKVKKLEQQYKVNIRQCK